MQYKIASFNMYKFKAYEFSEEIKKDLSMIAKIINEEKFDIVAMQEVLNDDALKKLMLYLNGKWDFRWGTPDSKYGSVISLEGYGFIWRSDKLSLITTKLDDGTFRTFEPRIYNQYQKGNLQQRLVRNPYYIRLKPRQTSSGWYEIRLVDTHIMFSKNKAQQEHGGESLPSDVKMRQNEQEILCKSIYPKIATKRYGDNMPAYTILLGDYNLNLPGGNPSPYLKQTITLDTTKKEIITTQYEKTSLSNKEPVFVNNYDHFSYDKSISQYCKNPRRVNTVYKYYEKGDKNLSPKEAYAEHKKQVSDHVPIVMDFDIKSETELSYSLGSFGVTKYEEEYKND